VVLSAEPRHRRGKAGFVVLSAEALAKAGFVVLSAEALAKAGCH